MGKSTKDMTPTELEGARRRSRQHKARVLQDPVRRAKQYEANRRYKMKAKYGITYEEFCALIDEQGGVCAMCKTQALSKESVPRVESERTVIDHCHENGHVRGVLCSPCNLMLGYARDDVERLEAGIAYLKERG